MIHRKLTKEDVDRLVNEARVSAPFMNANDRSLQDVESDAYKGFVGELTHHAMKGTLTEWWVHREKMRGKHDDDGIDDPDGTNVKTYGPWDQYVSVKKGDTRAKRFVAYRFDPRTNVVTRVGQFTYDDCHEVYPNVWGVNVTELKEIQE